MRITSSQPFLQPSPSEGWSGRIEELVQYIGNIEQLLPELDKLNLGSPLPRAKLLAYLDEIANRLAVLKDMATTKSRTAHIQAALKITHDTIHNLQTRPKSFTAAEFLKTLDQIKNFVNQA